MILLALGTQRDKTEFLRRSQALLMTFTPEEEDTRSEKKTNGGNVSKIGLCEVLSSSLAKRTV